MKRDKLTGLYYDYAMAAPYMAGVNEKDELDILILGMGSGTYATQCNRFFDNLNIEGVEIDQKITDLAREYFELPDDVRVYTYDGRAFLNATNQTYDVIMIDAYQDITIPFQMSSKEFFLSVKNHLREDGVAVVNMNMRSGSEGSINEYLTDTIGNVFDSAYSVDVKGSTNREVFATDNQDVILRMQDNLNHESSDKKELIAMMEEILNELTLCQTGSNVMSDDKAPVELLGMRAIDEIIKEEVSYYKDIYDSKGFRGIAEIFLQ